MGLTPEELRKIRDALVVGKELNEEEIQREWGLCEACDQEKALIGEALDLIDRELAKE